MHIHQMLWKVIETDNYLLLLITCMLILSLSGFIKTQLQNLFVKQSSL